MSSSQSALITVAVPSLNQGRYLAESLTSILSQELPIEVYVADGGSSDQSVEIIKQFAPRLTGWRSHPDAGQAAAINECIAKGHAPYVCWLNSDDVLLPGGLAALVEALDKNANSPAAYGQAWNIDDRTQAKGLAWVEPFDPKRLARRCIISQPATLIRRTAWENIGGLDEALHFAMDYDLWWRLYRRFGALRFVDHLVAINRHHDCSKSSANGYRHYREAFEVVRRYETAVSLKDQLIPLPVRWRLARIRQRITRLPR